MSARRLIGFGLLSLALLGGSMAWHNRVHLQAFPGILGAYSAKEYCSCRYVTGNPAAYCAGYVAQYLPLGELLDDPLHKRVSARALGSRQQAQWLGPRLGCRLLPAEG